MKPRALLINPWIYDFSAYNLWYRPLGLLYIASLLRTNGVDVSFIDCLEEEAGAIHEGYRAPGKTAPPLIETISTAPF
jgi:hypothetical protein